MGKIVDLGTKTQWGEVAAVTNQGGERYYMMTKNGVVSLMPASLIEPPTNKEEKNNES